MNPADQKEFTTTEIDASCRVPLFALFGGAALWLVVGLMFALLASLTFHLPEKFGSCPMLTYGRIFPAANDLLLFGFAVPAGLGVLLWIFARLSQTELALPLVPVAAANIWHVGVLVGTVAILTGHSTGFQWLEFPRGGSVLLFAAFLLIAISAMATFGARRVRELYPSHFFLLAALFWFPWIYSTANLFLVAWPVRGVAQAVIDWWFGNNLVYIWLSLVGLGAAFYFLPKISGRPLQTYFYALFAFCTLILFGTFCGINEGAPVPAWLPSLSAVASGLLIIPIIAVAVIVRKTLRGANVVCRGGPFCFIKFGTTMFILSSLMIFVNVCPHASRLVEFTWFGQAQTQLQILGFFAMIAFGAVYEILPRATGIAWPFPKFARLHFWLSMIGVLLLVLPLAIGGVLQGVKLADGALPFIDSTLAALKFLRVSTLGLLLLLLGSLLFALNIFVMTFTWKMKLLKTGYAAVIAPLEKPEVKP